MGGVGRGNAAEDTLQKKEQNQGQFTDEDLSEKKASNQKFTGNISCSNIPEKIEFIDTNQTTSNNNDKTLPAIYERAEELELQYEILTEGKGLEVLETLEENGETSEFSDELIELMSDYGLLKTSEAEIEFTPRGNQAYNNWIRFRDNYLTGETEKDRFDAIEARQGVEVIPELLEESSGVEVTLDQYLQNKKGARSRYDPESEFKSMMEALYGNKSSELGQRVQALEVLSNPDHYENHEVSEEVQQEFQDAVPLGLVDGRGILTQDGETIYRKVKTDSYFLN